MVARTLTVGSTSTQPKPDGPTTMPAMISRTIDGWASVTIFVTCASSPEGGGRLLIPVICCWMFGITDLVMKACSWLGLGFWPLENVWSAALLIAWLPFLQIALPLARNWLFVS